MRKLETAIHIDASPEAVWKVLVDFARLDWNPLFLSVEGTLAEGERLKIVLRKPKVTIRPRITVFKPGHVLEWLGSLGIPGLVDGRHLFELTAANGGTHFRHEETFSGILVPLLGRVLTNTKVVFEALNQALKTEVERGGVR